MSDACQTLGVRLAPDGNNDAEFHHLWEETLKWKQDMLSAKISRPAADFGIQQVLMPKLCYPLVAITFMEAQCQGIMQPVLQQGLLALRVNHNFPRAVAHGPVAYQGLNLPDLYIKQMISHILTILKFGNLFDDPTEVLIWVCGELLQLAVGMCGPLFSMSPYLQVCTTDSWFSQYWLFCIQRGIFIDDNIKDFIKPRETDQTIMEIFLRSGYREMELAALNQCRMFLHVIFISDITNGQGTTIDTQYWSGSAVSETHNYHWPRTICPMPKEWKQWQQALTRSLNLGQVQTLTLPLGKWYALTLELNGWFTDAKGLQLFHKSDQKLMSFTPAPLHRRLCSFHATPMAISDNAQQIELLHVTI